MRKRLRFALLLSTLCAGVNCLFGQQQNPPRIVETIDVRGIDSLIHNRKDKALFLNLWATWCKPCVEEFPDIVTLYNEFRNAGVDIVAISVDYPDEVTSKILPFLDSLNVPFKTFVANVKKDEDLINELNPSWSGAVPATFIFDKNGKQRTFMFGQKSLNAFKIEIDSTLNPK